MNASFIRIFSTAQIQFHNGHSLGIEESSDGLFNLTISDSKAVRVGIKDPDATHFMLLEDLISAWKRERGSTKNE